MLTETRTTLEQREAKFALECIDHVKERSFAAEYHRLAKRIPAMILGSGLGPTLAFICATAGKRGQSESAASVIYSHFREWLTELMDVYSTDDDLLKNLMTNDMNSYLVAQDLALRFATWLSRLADAFLPKEGSE